MNRPDSYIEEVPCSVKGCGGTVRFRRPEKPGTYEKRCSAGHVNRLRFKGPGGNVQLPESDENDESTTSAVTHTVLSVRARLTVIPAGIFGRFRKKTYTLKPGPTTIGRYDEACRCDVEIYGDSFVSRRSLLIDTAVTDTGFVYKMTVMKAANPVELNGGRLKPGDTVFLNYGDIIRAGKTYISFQKDQPK